MSAGTLVDRVDLAARTALRSDLQTADPYDVWKTAAGFAVKDFYNEHRLLGLAPAAALSAFDLYVNDRRRWFYASQEYPIVRAWAALILLTLYEHGTPDDRYVAAARDHLHWLLQHGSPGYGALCWGIGFPQAISAGLHYPADLPLASMTPYPLEAFARYARLPDGASMAAHIPTIQRFFVDVLPVVEETDEYLIPAYAPLGDRRVVNIASYVLWSLAQASPFVEPCDQVRADVLIRKLYAFIRRAQRPDGAWLYALDGPPFIDCFHSCIVLKNLIRAGRVVELPGLRSVVERGVEYVLTSFIEPAAGLYRRFSLANKPSPIRFDLYDNAEVIHLLVLLGRLEEAVRLEARVAEVFVAGDDVYSSIDRFGHRRRRNHLRWATLPYLHSVVVLATAMGAAPRQPASPSPHEEARA